MKIKIILVSIWVLVIVPSMTYSLFVDTETSVGNTFSATTLEATLTPGTTSTNLNITFTEPFTSTFFTLTNVGQLNTINSLSVENISNTDFADKILVSVHYSDTPQHFPSLTSLNMVDYLFQNVGDINRIDLVFSITEENYNNTAGETVTFTIKNYARQSGMPFGNGFFDNETMEITITNPKTIDSSKPSPTSPAAP